MKITSHEVIIVDSPLERPFTSGGVIPSSSLRHVILKLHTDEGISGLGWSFSHSHNLIPALANAIDDVVSLIHGDDPLMREEIREKILKVTRWAGPGLTHWVQATVNFALWDITGKAAGEPVWKLLGGHASSTVPTYASSWLWRDYSLDELNETAGELAQRGFNAMKFRCGSEDTISAEADRAHAVRSAVGDDIRIMVDINESWDVPRTMEVARHFESQGVFWLEDPIDHRDLTGYRQLTNALDLSICHGEYNYGHEPFMNIVQAGAVDIAMIDAHHAGGIDAWMKAAAVCEAAYRPVVTHLSPEIAVHLAAATPNCMMVEFMNWSFGLFNEVMEIDSDGRLIVPQAPGLGVTLNEDAVTQGLVTS